VHVRTTGYVHAADVEFVIYYFTDSNYGHLLEKECQKPAVQ